MTFLSHLGCVTFFVEPISTFLVVFLSSMSFLRFHVFVAFRFMASMLAAMRLLVALGSM